MRNYSIKLVTLLATSLAVTSTFACGGRGNGGGLNGGINRNVRIVNSSQGQCSTSGGYAQNGQVGNGQVFNGRALEPFHSTHNPFPTDSFYIVSLKEYGTSDAAPFIAAFNGMQVSDSLANVTRLQLPSISKDGRMSPSRAPLSDADQAAQRVATTPAPQPAATSAPTAAPLPNIASGSTLKIGGQSLGENGSVRLKVGGLSLPVEVIEWSAESATVRLPSLDVTASTKAELEVVRADGTLAAKNGLNLTPTAAQPAQAIAKK
jgi:hypothetical protein